MAGRGRVVAGAWACCLLEVACAGAPRPARPPSPAEVPPPEDPVSTAITEEEMRRHVAWLASDALRGRETPGPGLERAAEYIAERFEAAGLVPPDGGSGYVRRWSFDEASLRTAGTQLAIRTPEGFERPEYREGFFLLPGQEEQVSAAPVLAGTASGVADGFPAEARGRAAVVLMPPSFGMELLSLTRAAAVAGAAAVVFVLPPEVPRRAVRAIAGQIENAGLQPGEIPGIGMPDAVAARMFRSAGWDLATLRDEAGREGFEPIGLPGVELELRAPLDRHPSEPPNVIGALQGEDPALAGTWVAVVAHFDHVGAGLPDASGDSIYNGADDNASGTAALLEVAEAMATGAPPRRSVLFLAVSGEEKGLLGSRAFVDDPAVPLDRIVAAVNLDMVGRNHPDTVVAVGYELTDLGRTVERVARDHPELGLVPVADPNPREGALVRSDQLPFLRREIPSLFLTTWLHEDYHRPSDEAGALDADKAARVARLVQLLVTAVADAREAPAWEPGGLERLREALRLAPF